MRVNVPEDTTPNEPDSFRPASLVRSVSAPVRALADLLLVRDGPAARAFETLILALIALSVLSFGIESTPDLPRWVTQTLRAGEIVVVAVFSLEYVLRIVAARRKLAYIFSFYGLVDLLSVAPFYLAGVDARALRALRVVREAHGHPRPPGRTARRRGDRRGRRS